MRNSRPAGGLSFPFDPYVSAASTPALWSPDATPGSVALQPAPGPYQTELAFDPRHFGPILAEKEDVTGLHLVIDDPDGRLRLWLIEPSAQGGVAILVVPDRDYALRLALAERVARRLHGEEAGDLPSGFRPTDFQRQRLTMLLGLLDLLAQGLSTRELSDAAIYPNHQLRGAAWRGANERRHVQRLRDEALHLVAGGYRDLLRGR